MIETRLLRQFVAVAEELHFHKAAQRLHMAQPPLSQAISRLEGKLGFSLFIRDKREVKLTPAGGAFLSAAYRTLKELEQGVEHARQVAAGVAGKLTITSVSISGYPSLLNSLRQFRQALPQVQLVIREMPSANQADAIVAGEADIAFRRRLPMTAANIETRLVLDEQIVIALPADHPKAVGGPVQLADFAEEDFVFTPAGLGIGYYSQLIALCDAAGFFRKWCRRRRRCRPWWGWWPAGLAWPWCRNPSPTRWRGTRWCFAAWPRSAPPATLRSACT